ncbi:MAG: aminopeptidase P family protein [Elusimicrobia bacterium]|nr:aminopeptidase P family protein [Elusimicrobiota bacterium]
MTHYPAIRKSLARRLPDGLILLSGGNPVPRNHDVDFVFRQKSDFLYLTGVEEPGCFLLIDPKRGREALFLPRIDNHHRVWLGDVPGPREARKLYGVAEAHYCDELPRVLKDNLGGYRKLYADGDAAKRAATKKLKVAAAELRDALDELRICKTPGELDLMRRAGEISSKAHKEVMRRTRPGMYEYQIQAIFEAECLKAGLKHLGYPSIVAAGRNGAVLHYHANNAQLKNGEFLLIDAGAECKGYSADITRTFPANGKFTQRQRDIYGVVLHAQKSCIERARPGIISADLHLHSMTVIAEGLKNLGILKGETSGLVEGGAVRLFYPHGLTHTLGLDVHDTLGGRKRRLPNPTKVPVRFVARLEPGFVVTMEPGVYFIEALLKDPELRRKHRGSVDFEKAEKFLDLGGVRIEDDVAVQRKGPPLNLTSVPKEIAEIEAACER